MHIGFTGTRQGMSVEQKVTLLQYIHDSPSEEAISFHSGDCVGADKEAFDLFKYPGMAYTIGHPPEDETWRAFNIYDEEREPKDYLDRNHDIVDESKFIIACPKEFQEQWRGSGTWATIRYARKKCRVGVIIFPDGTTKQITEYVKTSYS